jgi:integrase
MGVFKRPDSPFYWYKFRNDGKTVRRSTGATDHKVALQVYITQRNKHIQRKAVERLAPIKLSDLLATYLRDYAKVNKSSFDRDEIAIEHLNDFLGDKDASDISPRDLERYKSRRKQTVRGGKQITGATVNRELAILKTAFNKGIEWTLVDSNPVKKIKFFSEKDRARTRYLTADEKPKLFAVISPELRRFVIIALKTGMRFSEILGLKWLDIDSSANQILVRKSKSGKMRFIPLHPDVTEVLSSLSKHGPYAFSNAQGERYSRSCWIRTQFEVAVEKAEIHDFHVHDLRHTFASELVMKGVDLKTISELLGHSSTRMTERYSHLSPTHVSQAVNLLAIEAKPPQASNQPQ